MTNVSTTQQHYCQDIAITTRAVVSAQAAAGCTLTKQMQVPSQNHTGDVYVVLHSQPCPECAPHSPGNSAGLQQEMKLPPGTDLDPSALQL